MAKSGNNTDRAPTVADDSGIAALDQLENRQRDWLTPLAKGVVGACPVIGPMLAEIVGMVVPNQRVERIGVFLRNVDERIVATEALLDRFQQRIASTEGIDLLEESMTQATRAITVERQERLGRLLATALTQEELRYQEVKKLLGLLRELTDPELLWLFYYSTPVTFSSEYHNRLRKTHPEVFDPASEMLNASDVELDRSALQKSYKNTLERYGLLERTDLQQYQITWLGKMLLRYIGEENLPS